MKSWLYFQLFQADVQKTFGRLPGFPLTLAFTMRHTENVRINSSPITKHLNFVVFSNHVSFSITRLNLFYSSKCGAYITILLPILFFRSAIMSQWPNIKIAPQIILYYSCSVGTRSLKISCALLHVWRCLWCNGYRRRKWTQRHKFKSWTWLTAFHIALIPLGKVWIQLFSLQLWVNSRADWVLQPWWGNQSRSRKTLNSNLLYSA